MPPVRFAEGEVRYLWLHLTLIVLIVRQLELVQEAGMFVLSVMGEELRRLVMEKQLAWNVTVAGRQQKATFRVQPAVV